VQKSALTVFALMGFASSMAQATFIEAPITSGSAGIMLFPPGGPPPTFGFGLNGPNVSFSGGGFALNGTCFPEPFNNVPCTAGSTQNRGFAFDNELTGIAGEVTVGSVSFRFAAAPDTETDAFVGFQLSFTIPVVGPVPPGTLTIIAPFTAAATLDTPPNAPPFDPQGFALRMTGQGLATLNLGLASPSPATYVLQNAHFEFTPEPAAILLSCIGLLGLILLRRRSRCIPR
jgi:hypothetical protein